MIGETRTAPGGPKEWMMDDDPIHLRLWGTNRVYRLPAPATGTEWIIGAEPTCWLRIQDQSRYVSKHHAALRRDPESWVLRDLDSKNGLWIDSARRSSTPLVPGVEVGIGTYRFVAESRRSVVLRALLARMLGWDATRFRSIDRALRALRGWTTLRAPLGLIGEGDLIAVARRLHRETVGASGPFVTCLPRTRREPSASAPRNYPRAIDGLAAAAGGTLCIIAGRPPVDLRDALKRIDDPEHAARVVVCSRAPTDIASVAIRIPALSERLPEVERVVEEFAIDAIAAHNAKPTSWTARDREWLLERSPRTLAEIEVATSRLVAVREWGGVTKAAPHVGLSHAALSRWLSRRVPR
jgi:hypothetical protein